MSIPPVVVPEGFDVIAHRGASGYAPENTLAAFRLAREMRSTEIEFDVQLSADGVAVIVHDKTLERYGHGKRVVEELGSRELSALDMGSWLHPRFAGERMPTLAGLFETFGAGFVYHLEVKGERAGIEEEIARIVAASGLEARVKITSFRASALERMKVLAPGLPLGRLVNALDSAALADARRMGLAQLCPRAEDVTAESVAAAKRVVPEVRAWGLSGTPDEVRALIRRVVDAGCDGMTLNWPDWAVFE